MKKFFVTLLLTMCLIPCAFILSACGGGDGNSSKISIHMVKTTDPGVESIYVYDASEHSENSSHSYLSWTSGLPDQYGRIPKGKDYIVIIHLNDGYDYGNLQVKIEFEDKDGKAQEDVSDLLKIENLLSICGSEHASEFSESKEKGVAWQISKDAVNKIRVSLIGSAEQEQYSLSISQESGESYENIVNHNALRFSIDIDNVALKNQAQSSEFTASEFVDMLDIVQNREYVYGSNVTIKVWFNNGVPFNDWNFVKYYNAYDEHYTTLAFDQLYYETETGKTIYNVDIHENTALQLDWKGEEDVDYDAVKLEIIIGSNGYSAVETLTHNEIEQNGAIYTINNVSEFEYDLLVSGASELYFCENSEATALTRNQKIEMFTYVDGTLTCDLGIVSPMFYAEEMVDGGQRLRFNRGNTYTITVNFNAEKVKQDNSLSKIALKYMCQGEEFDREYVLPNQDYVHIIIHEISGSAMEIDNGGLIVYDPSAEDIRLGIAFDIFPPIEGTSDRTKFEKIVVSNGTNSFDITYDADNCKFVATSTIDGLTTTIEGDLRFILSADFLSQNTELTFTIYVKDNL